MAPNDLQTQDLSTPQPVADASNDQTGATPVDDAGDAGNDDNAYLADLIADADSDEDSGVGETPGGTEDGGTGQAAADDQPDAGSPTQTDDAGEGDPPTPAPEPVQDGQQAPAPQATPEPTPQADQQPQAQQQADASQTTQDFNTQFAEFFEQRVEALAQNVYALDDATREALDSEPSKVIPQLAGRLHMQVLTTALTQVAQMLPTALQEFSQQNTANQEAEDAFYSEWSSLKPHSQTVEKVAAVYMQMNPGVEREKAIKDIGTMVSVQLGIPINPPAPTPQAQQPASQTQPVALTPPAPASAAGGAAQSQQPAIQGQSWLENWVKTEE